MSSSLIRTTGTGGIGAGTGATSTTTGAAPLAIGTGATNADDVVGGANMRSMSANVN